MSLKGKVAWCLYGQLRPLAVGDAWAGTRGDDRVCEVQGLVDLGVSDQVGGDQRREDVVVPGGLRSLVSDDATELPGVHDPYPVRAIDLPWIRKCDNLRSLVQYVYTCVRASAAARAGVSDAIAGLVID